MKRRMLIANRGEIALRIASTAIDMGLAPVVLFSEDDIGSRHVLEAHEAIPLSGSGPSAYLDAEQIVSAAIAAGCHMVHPGYGFLSEDASFARRCAEAGLTFIGPSPETLTLLGDKTRALHLAESLGIPVIPGTRGATSLVEAREFMAGLGPSASMMVKALAGGGGRGMRVVDDPDALPETYRKCSEEARQAFGSGDLYVERFFERARHVEVQIAGDGSGEVSHLWDRECSLQRHRQKLIEIAPAVMVPNAIRTDLLACAVRIGKATRYKGVGTIEFLVDCAGDSAQPFAFIEANPRLQVEHTVTEFVTGLDLVGIQIGIAAGRSLENLDLRQADLRPPVGIAVQSRINAERISATGISAADGTISSYVPPTGPGVRVDGIGYVGMKANHRFDSLLAKLVVHVHGGDPLAAFAKSRRALGAFEIAGLDTNRAFLGAILQRLEDDVAHVHTRYVEEHLEALLDAADRDPSTSPAAADNDFPDISPAPEGMSVITAPTQGALVSVVAPGHGFRTGECLAVVEAMKMQHEVAASFDGRIESVLGAVGDLLREGQPLLFASPSEGGSAGDVQAEEQDLDHIRPDLAETLDRHAVTLDEARPDAVARRRKTGQRTARENIADLVDPGSFVEFGQLTVAARRQRHSLDELIEQTPADGLVAGFGRVNGASFPDEAARCLVMAYDYTVLAGTQGVYGHKKTDRLIETAERYHMPMVIFCEGGGGRPGDTESGGPLRSFQLLARMSGSAPSIGIASGRCFAGNAATLGCCDVIIATRNSSIGMGGPAMVEGGGLGVVAASDIGPIEVQGANGVVDIVVEDEAAAVAAAKKYLSYFQGALPGWSCADQRHLRRAIPENRMRSYDMRALVAKLADDGSMMELRPKFGAEMITALIRVEGRPFGLIANNPKVNGGAIASDSADKAARFMQLCEAFRLPIVSLSDTPGIMVGPEAEKSALVRHCSRMLVVGANLSVPMFSIILRKSYGLGGVAMTGGSSQNPVFSVAWPTGEFGAMGIEGAVKLGYKNELAAIADADARQARYEALVREAVDIGKALNRATTYGLDDVIDPADTRRWLTEGWRSVAHDGPSMKGSLKWIDTW